MCSTVYTSVVVFVLPRGGLGWWIMRTTGEKQRRGLSFDLDMGTDHNVREEQAFRSSGVSSGRLIDRGFIECRRELSCVVQKGDGVADHRED